MRRAAMLGVGLVAAGALLAGCGEDEEKPAPETAKQVADTIARLERSTLRRDFHIICNELFTAEARRRSGGRNCARLLRTNARDVREPRIRLLSVRIEDEKATAKVRTTARGQAPVEDEIALERQRGGYRIASLAG